MGMTDVVFCCKEHPRTIIYHEHRDCPLCLMKREIDKLLREGTLQVDLKEQAGITVILYNICGQKALELSLGKCSSGVNRIPIDLSLLVPGYYNVEIQSSAGKATGKLVIAR